MGCKQSTPEQETAAAPQEVSKPKSSPSPSPSQSPRGAGQNNQFKASGPVNAKAKAKATAAASNNSPKGGKKSFEQTYTLGKVLGEGAFSVVRAAVKKDTGESVAIKCIAKKNLSKEDETALKQEVQILQELDHPHILKCYGFFDEPGMFYLPTEIMEGGELFDRIVKKTYYNEKEARDLILILISTIGYCHSKNIVHRDLKPENLLLSGFEDDSHIKLADFGFAIQTDGYVSLKTQCGTPGYVAPEILSTQRYGKSVDMWSIGVITYILLGGYPPFHDDNQKALFKKIKGAEYEFHDEYWSEVSDEAKDLIRHLLKINPVERYTAEEALNHPWVRVFSCPVLSSHPMSCHPLFSSPLSLSCPPFSV
jgi:calcium/calmodulin-dependent protein kinase I